MDEEREAKLQAAALDRIEARLYDGTATADETVRFFRMGS